MRELNDLLNRFIQICIKDKYNGLKYEESLVFFSDVDALIQSTMPDILGKYIDIFTLDEKKQKTAIKTQIYGNWVI